MSAVQVKELHGNSKRGFFYLSFRTLLLHGIQICSVFFLSKWLSPDSYGIYAILNGYISVSWFFCDVGLGGALTQQLEAPTHEQLQTCAMVQIGLGTFFAASFYLAAPMIASHHQLGSRGVDMMRVLALTIPFYACRGVPRIFIDRTMNFSLSGTLDLIEGTVTYSTQILLAGLGFGAWSFILANVSRALGGDFLLLLWQRKFVWPRLRWPVLQPLLKFGIAFQASAIVPALRGLVVPLALGSFLPVSQVGLITWVVGLASIPMVMAANFNQVLFVSLSRARASAEDFVRLASRSYELALFGIAFLYGAGAALGPHLIAVLFSAKWQEARAFFQVATLSVAMLTVRYLGAAVLNASGRPHSRLKIEVLALGLEYLCVIVAVTRWGAKGYFWAMVIVNALLAAMTFYAIRDLIRAETYRRFLATFASSVLSAILVSKVLPEWNLFAQTPLFVICFLAGSFMLNPSTYQDLRWLLRVLRNPAQLVLKGANA